MDQWKKNLYVLWIMQFLVMIGMSSVLLFIPLYVSELGVKDLELARKWSGFIVSATYIFAAFFSPIWGAVGDRFGRKVMIMRGVLGFSVFIMLLGLARTPAELLVLRILQGCFGGFISADITLISTSAPKGKVGSAVGFLHTSIPAGGMIGPVLGGVLGDLIGYRYIFFITGTLSLLGGMITLFFLKEEHSDIEYHQPVAILSNLKFTCGSPVLLTVCASLFVTQIAMMMPQPVLAHYTASLGAPEGKVGMVSGIVSAGAAIAVIIGAPIWGRYSDRVGHRRGLGHALAGAAVLYAPQAFVSSNPQLFGLRFGHGLFIAGIAPASQGIIAGHAPAQIRGGVIGIASMSTLLGNAIGPVIGGYASASLGMRAVFLVTAFLMLVAYGVLAAGIRMSKWNSRN